MRRIPALLFVVLCLSAFARPSSAQNQTSIIRRLIHEFVGVGGYWFTDRTANDALGSPKFTGTTSLFVKPAHRHNMLITGGIELVGASDHWLLGGGNEFSLSGAAFRVSGPRKQGIISPFVTGGAYIGHIRSERLGFSETTGAGSGAFGLEYKFHRYFTITGRYRITTRMHGINTDGFAVSLKFF